MISWPDKLIDSLARRKCVIFIGSGVSANSKNEGGVSPKTWEDLLATMKDKITNDKIKKEIDKLISEKNYLTACGILTHELKTHDYIDTLEKEFSEPHFNHAKIHEFILNLDSRIIITPNFDSIYDTYARSTMHGDVKIKTHKEHDDILDSIRTNKYLIIKMHGTIESPKDLIFSQQQYAEARIKYNFFYNIISALALTHTFLFIGCGQNDPDIKMIFEDNYFKYKCSHPHYFIRAKKRTRGTDVTGTIFSNLLNLEFLEYTAAKDHSKLTDSLEQLVDLTAQKRLLLASTVGW